MARLKLGQGKPRTVRDSKVILTVKDWKKSSKSKGFLWLSFTCNLLGNIFKILLMIIESILLIII